RNGVEREPDLRIAEEARIVGAADRIVAAPVVERAHLVSHYGADASRIAVIPCGVDTELFAPGDQAAARAALGLDARPRLLYVGRLAPIQGLETLLDRIAPAHGGVATGWPRGRAARATEPSRSGRRGHLRGAAAAGAPANLVRGGRRHRAALVLRVVRHGGPGGDGLRQPRHRLARGRAADDRARPGDRHARARIRPPPARRYPRARAGRRRSALASGARGGPLGRAA